MIAFIQWLAQMFGALVDLGWKVVLFGGVCYLALSVFRSMRGVKKPQTGAKLGFLQVNEGVNYRRKRALNRRRTSGQLEADDVVGDTNETMEADAPAPTTATADATVTTAAESPAACTHPGDEACARLRAKAYASPLPVVLIQISNDVMASQRTTFAKFVDEVIANKSKFSRVVVNASSPGGAVSQYGLMFTEMERLRRDSGLYITGVADEVAASGGMMQLLPVHELVMPPFAMVGSIGVVTEFLNFNTLLTTVGIEPIEITAGALKRTVTQFGKPTEEKIAHYKEQLHSIHLQFIAAVQKYRSVDPARVCTGDHWLAQEAVDQQLGLVDRLATSRELIFEANQEHDLIILTENASRWEKGIFRFLTKVVDFGISRVMTQYGPFGRI